MLLKIINLLEKKYLEKKRKNDADIVEKPDGRRPCGTLLGFNPPHFIGYLLKENSREIRWGQKNRESGIDALYSG